MAVVAFATPAPPLIPVLETPEAGVTYWKAFDATRQQWYRRMTRVVARQFASEARIVDAVVRRQSLAGAAAALMETTVAKQQPAWIATLRTVYEDVGLDFARRIDGGLKAVYAPATKAGSVEDVWMATIHEWFGHEATLKALQITATTKADLLVALRQGIAAGDSIPQLAKRLQDTYDDMELERAVTIARTETIAASNLGSRAGALHTGLALTHTWLPTAGHRTRPWHAAARGQTVPLGELYTVGGQRLLFPGDSMHGATGKNLVNCRCTETYARL